MAKRKYLDETRVLQELYVSPTSSGQYVAGYDSKGNRVYTADKTKSMGYNEPRAIESRQAIDKKLVEANKPNLGKEWADIAQTMIGTPMIVTTPVTNMGLQFGNKVLNNPLAQTYFTYDAIKNGPKHIKDIYNQILQQRYFKALGNTGLLALDVLGVHGAKKGLEATGRRAAETAMRTTSSSNPLPEIEQNFKSMLRGEYGGKKRLYDILNYVITGNKTGNKGWYNSFARGSNRHLDHINYYDGSITAWPNNQANDIIDAYLYGKTIDEDVYGLKKVAEGTDFGVHDDYIKREYWNKRKKIPVYETTGTNKQEEVLNELPEGYRIAPWYGAEHGFNTGKVELNVAGHLRQNAYSPGKYVAGRQQDIWKFNPKDYYKKWLEDVPERELPGPFKKALIMSGLHAIDYLGTPVISRTPWVRAKGLAFKCGGSLPRRSLATGGRIYIKPSHRGRLTELKARTGKSEAELYNDGNPAHKKMVVFARNARKWKH